MPCALKKLVIPVMHLSAALCARGQQTTYQPAYQHGGRFTLPPGVYVTVPDMMDPLRSMDDLIERSDIIIDGTVIAVFPSIDRHPGQPGEVETDSLIGVRQVIRGQVPQAQIVLVESGGTQGQWQFLTRGNPLVKQS